MNAIKFRLMFAVIHDLDLSQLEQAGVIKPGANGGSDWTRFNNDIGTFVLKLPSDRLEKLADLIEAEMAEMMA